MIAGTKLMGLILAYGLVGLGGGYAVDQLVGDRMTRGDHGTDHHVEVRHVQRIEHRVVHRQGACAHEVERSVALEAPGGDALRIRAGSGELRVEGVAGLASVEAVGRACASDEAYLDELLLTLDQDAEGPVLSAHYPERSGGWRNDYARIDLTVRVPLGMALDVDDSSGGIELSGVGALTIDDSSGEIVARDVDGSVDINDSSGGIELEGVNGSVSIDDGSGEIHLRGIAVDVRLRDGSGEIEVVGVGADVIVEGDGSGEIDIADVGGSVVIEADGSGSIDVRDVGGDFTVLADGTGSIRYRDIGGEVTIPRHKRNR